MLYPLSYERVLQQDGILEQGVAFIKHKIGISPDFKRRFTVLSRLGLTRQAAIFVFKTGKRTIMKSML